MSDQTQLRGFARKTKWTVAVRFATVQGYLLNTRGCQFLWAALLFLFLGLTHPVFGQNAESSGSGPADVAGEQPTAAVPTSEITVLAAAETINLQRIEKLSESPDAYSWLSPAVADEERAIALLLGELDQIDTTRISTRELEDQRHWWQEHQDQQARWLIDLNARWRTLQRARDDLERIRERWQLTRDAPSWQELPEELRQNVIEIIDQVGPLQEKTQERVTQIASVLGRLMEAQQHTSDALGRLDAISDRVNERLLRQDAEPLWRLHDLEARELLDSVQTTGRRWAEEVTQFAETHPTVLLVHLLLFVGLLAATLVARHGSRSWLPSEAKFARTRFVASRPYAVAFVLSILAVPGFYGSAPASVRDLFGFLLIVPMLRLGSGLMNKAERISLHNALVLFAVHLLVHICPGGSHLQRIMLLAATALGVLLLARVIWLWRGDDRIGYWNRVAFGGTCLAFALLSVALIGNVIGWLSMAGLLVDATVTSGLGACIAVLIVRAGTCLAPLAARGVTGRLFPSLRRNGEQFERIVQLVLVVLVLLFWSRGTLDRFRLLEPLAEQWGILSSLPLSWTGLSVNVGQVLRAVGILVVSILALRCVSFILREEVFPKLRLRPGVAGMLTLLSNYAVVGIGLVMAAAVLGLTATQLTVLFGALGVGIGFGLQNIVNNLVSGLILVCERPLKVGDRVEASGNLGIVKKIGVRATVVRTLDGAEVIVPNSDLISKEVTNWTLSDPISRIELRVGVAYGSDPDQMIAVLRQVAAENSRVLLEPEPLALMVGFGDSSLDFRMLCWTSDEDRLEVVSELHLAVDAALRDAGIVIPFPQRDLHVKSGTAPLVSSSSFPDGEIIGNRSDGPHETVRKVHR
jgi:small-conductance mechanosensitive channel